MTTEGLHDQDDIDTEPIEFDLFRDHEDSLFLQLFAEVRGIHILLKTDEDGIERLQERLNHPPRPLEKKE